MAVPVVQIVLSLGLGVIFAASAIPKLRHPKGFILTVLEYRILPPFLGRLYARLLPPVELFVALLLLTGTALRLAAAVSSFLLANFIIAVGINLARGRDLDCGCFGESRSRVISWRLVLEDVGLLGTSLLLGRTGEEWVTTEAWSVFNACGLAHTVPLAPLMICLLLTLVAAVILSGFKRGRTYRALRVQVYGRKDAGTR